MLKNKSCLLVNIGERSYEFSCDCNSPLGEVHDALSQMKNFVVQEIVKVSEQENQEKKNG